MPVDQTHVPARSNPRQTLCEESAELCRTARETIAAARAAVARARLHRAAARATLYRILESMSTSGRDLSGR